MQNQDKDAIQTTSRNGFLMDWNSYNNDYMVTDYDNDDDYNDNNCNVKMVQEPVCDMYAGWGTRHRCMCDSWERQVFKFLSTF